MFFLTFFIFIIFIKAASSINFKILACPPFWWAFPASWRVGLFAAIFYCKMAIKVFSLQTKFTEHQYKIIKR